MPRPIPSNLYVFKRVAGADPAAGNEITPIVVTAGKSWELLSVYLPLAQGITQTPQPILQIDDGANLIAELYGSTAAQAVSTTCGYTWAAGFGATSGQVGSGVNVKSFAPLPEGFILPASFRIKTLTLGIGANSDYGVPSLYVIEYG